jgi:Skp family chaperone for outer membrane proteins
MKKLMQIAFLCAGIAGFGFAAHAADQKIAIFNLRKAFESYYKTIQSNLALKLEAGEADKERSQMIENGRRHEAEWQKLIDKANDQAVSADEREKSKQAAAQKYAELESDKQSITDFDRMAGAKLREKQNLRRNDIVKEILGVLEAHAKTAGYFMVLDTSGESANMAPVVLYTSGQDDLTDSIIKELNAGAPPGSLDTNGIALPPSTNALTAPRTFPK